MGIIARAAATGCSSCFTLNWRRQRFCTEGNDESAFFGNIGNKLTLILKIVIIQAGQDKGFRIYQHDRAVP